VREETALLTFSIGPVHSFITQARRVSDLWAGSYLLSHLTRQAIRVVKNEPGGSMLFPYIEPKGDTPDGIPNRFVCRVPLARADEIALQMKAAVEEAWNATVRSAVRFLGDSLTPPPSLWTEEPRDGRMRQTDRLLDISWSWVPENGDYASASLEGARLFNAVRHFRPFSPIRADGVKCAICGERTALPNGDRAKVKKAWEEAAEVAIKNAHGELARFLRADQGRLCLVCATKRFFPHEHQGQQRFAAFDEFPPSERAPYFALVMMDGDRMSRILSLGPEEVSDGDLEGFHREVSKALTDFSAGLRIDHSADLNLAALGYPTIAREERPPQLIYAGGEDVLFVCDPRDALLLVKRIRDRYLQAFDPVRPYLKGAEDPFTISAAILFAHPSHPAGLAMRDLEVLLKSAAKDRAGRDAVALRLAKRSGVPEEVAFRWNDAEAPEGGWLENLEQVASRLRGGEMTSRQTFTLRLEERTLVGVFGKDLDRWTLWLADRLARHEGASGESRALAELVAPFFAHDHAAALRIARFLGREVDR
jgi:CRISPR-associated protein Cmr2